MKVINDKIDSVAKTNSTVLITGESGTGKSVLARKIHSLSNRRNNKFISVHCGALPESLIESELFGHEKGAFTGAIRKKIGKFELADGGTIFLDEIGTVSQATQIRLLQVLQERFIQRVGGEESIKIDIRVIAATNCDLKKLILNKSFREDLYYRLNVFQIELPALRNRYGDIEELSKEVLKRLNKLYEKQIDSFDVNVINAFKCYDWPGNIRELENLIERAYVLEKGQVLTVEHFPEEIFKSLNHSKSVSFLSAPLKLREARRKIIDAFEKRYTQEILIKTEGDVSEASAICGIGIRQMHKLLAKHKIKREELDLQK